MIDQTTFASIIDDVACHGNVRQALRENGVIDPKTLYRHILADDEACQQYMRAKHLGCHAYADETEEIQAEEPPLVESDKGGPRVDTGWVQWQKNRVELRRWHLSKLMPKVYGDKIQTEHSGSVSVTTIDYSKADD